MKEIVKDNYIFYKETIGNANFIFSTAENNLDFNINTDTGMENLEKLKEWFGLREIGYLHQIHSDLVYNYDGEKHQGDGLITARKECAVGVFTADCVPILLYDSVRNIVSAVHSGWRGTVSGIILNAIEKMVQEYGCKVKDIYAIIGPHNRSCCYEIGEDVSEIFKKNELFKYENIFINGCLDIEKCVIKQMCSKGVPRENIKVMNFCTYCNDKVRMHSYRKSKELSGRMFSFIYLHRC